MKKIPKTLVATALAMVGAVVLSGCVMILPMHFPGPWMMHGPLPFPSSVPGPTHTDPPFDFEGEAKKTREFAQAVIGMKEAQAIAVIEAEGYTARIVSRDGESYPVTMDYRVDRINLYILKGIVDRVDVG